VRLIRNKRAAWEATDIPWYFYYIAMTAVVIFLMTTAIDSSKNPKLENYDLEQAILAQRIYKKIALVDIDTGRISSSEIKDDIKKELENAFYQGEAPRKTGAKIEIEGGETAYFNKKFYEDERPLAPARNIVFIHKKTFAQDNSLRIVTIEEVYPKKYGDE